MKKTALLLFVLISLTVSAQQSDIKGVVSIHNSQFKTGTRQYVQNAQVEDDFAKATPTTTDATGNFKLVFVGADKGKSVVLSIKKAGLQVVNSTDLTAVAGQTDALKISMAHPDSIAEYRKRLYNIGKSEAEKNLYAQLKKKGAAIEALQKDAQKNAAAIEKLQQEYAELDKYAKNIEEQAQDLARRYAPINLDDAAPLYREAFGYFQQGDLEKAMQILRGADLIGQADKILAERKAIGTIRQEANQRDSLQQQRTKDLLQVLGLKADLHQSRFEWDSARVCLELRVELDSTNVQNLWDLANLLYNQKETQKAIDFYEKALRLSKSEDLMGNFCHNLGILYAAINKTSEAEKYYLKALEIKDRMFKNNPKLPEVNFARTEMSLGNLYSDINNMPEAEKYYLKALETYERVSQKDTLEGEADLPIILMNLGIFYKELNKMSKSENYYLKSIEICERLSKINPQQFEFRLAATANNMGEFYRINGKTNEAEKYYFKSLEIYERLAKNNPQRFEGELALTIMNLGNFYYINKRLDAEKYYLRSLEIYERLSKTNPQQFQSDLARTMMNMGNYYSDNNRVSEGEKYYLKALVIYEQLSKSNPHKFDSYLASTLMNLGVFYQEIGKKPEAEKYLLESLVIREQLFKINPEQFEEELALILNNLGVFYKQKIEFDKAYNMYHRALTLLQKGLLNERLHFKKNYRLVFNNLGQLRDSFEVHGDHTKVIEIQTERAKSIEILKTVIENGDALTAQEYSNLSWFQLITQHNVDAEQSAKRGLELDSTQTWIKTNLAHALLFQNKDAEAKKVYDELKNQKYTQDKSYRDILKEDFDTLEQAGLDKNQLDKARQWIKD